MSDKIGKIGFDFLLHYLAQGWAGMTFEGSGTGRELKKPIPDIREREGNWTKPIPEVWER